MKNIQYIIFDLGGVILNIDYKKTENAFINYGFETFGEVYSQLSQSLLFDQYETGKISTDIFIDAILKTAPNLTRDNIISAWNAMLLDLPEEKIEFIQSLRRHYKVFLYSNTNEMHETAFNKTVAATLGSSSLDPYFDKVYLSHKIGYRKPNADGFLHILNDQQIPAAATLFIDDSPQHIAGAANLGIQTLYLPKEKQLISELKQLLMH